jgi:RNA polymerase subunit RPABC4/transcription elongation factor Spt4
MVVMTRYERERRRNREPLDTAKRALQIKPAPEKLVPIRVCEICGAMTTLEKAVYCPMCGGSKFTQGRATEMVYRKIKLNESGKAVVCPHCDNEENTPGNYCMICGSEIVNHCADISAGGGREAKSACGTLLPGNARFCYACGNESNFYQKGWLRDWRSENTRKAIENINVTVDFDEIKSSRSSS